MVQLVLWHLLRNTQMQHLLSASELTTTRLTLVKVPHVSGKLPSNALLLNAIPRNCTNEKRLKHERVQMKHNRLHSHNETLVQNFFWSFGTQSQHASSLTSHCTR